MTFSYNLVMQQEADFNASFQINDANNTPINLTTMTIQSQMRHDYDSNVSIQFICNGYSNGYLTLFSPGSNTATANAGTYVYDVMMQDTFNNLARVIQGNIRVSPAVTEFT